MPAAARTSLRGSKAIWKLRKKLGPAGYQIETVIGFGYRFNEPCGKSSESARAARA